MIIDKPRKKLEDLTGRRYGMLVALEIVRHLCGDGKYRTKWKCKCDCGNETTVFLEHLKSGATTSCGCSIGKKISEAIKKPPNVIRVHDGTAWGMVDGDLAFCFDIEDADIVLSGYWCIDNLGYVTNKSGRLHRLLCAKYNNITGKVVDHINGCKWDNRMCNLRLTITRRNIWNSAIRKDNKTGCKGVTIHKGKYVAHITANKKAIHLGTFDTLEEANQVRLEAEKQYHGEFTQEMRGTVEPPNKPDYRDTCEFKGGETKRTSTAKKSKKPKKNSVTTQPA